MVRPKTRGERRRRNAIAKDLRTKKYAPKIIPAASEDDDWKQDLEDYYNQKETDT